MTMRWGTAPVGYIPDARMIEVGKRINGSWGNG